MRRAALLFLALAACHRAATDRPFTLHVAVVGPLAPLHPRLIETYAMLAHDLVYQGVLYPDRDGRPRSRIARKVERLGPGKFRLVLDPAARFSDGAPVAFEDVARAVAEAGGRAHEEGGAILLDGPPATFESALFYATVYRDVAGRFIGTASFRLAEQTAGRIRLERVRPAPGRIGTVEILAFPSERDVISHTLKGEANALVSLDVRTLEFFDGIPALKVVRAPGPHARVIELDERALGGGWRALQAALPTADLLRAGCGPNDAVLPQPTLHPTPLRRRSRVRLVINDSDPLQRRTALAIRRSLEPLPVWIDAVSTADFFATARRGEHDVVVRTALVWPPASAALQWSTRGAFNVTGFSSPAVDDALARGDADEIVSAIQREAPVVLLCRRERGFVVDARVKNPTLGSWGVLETLPDWEVEP